MNTVTLREIMDVAGPLSLVLFMLLGLRPWLKEWRQERRGRNALHDGYQ
jgi:hypothetical protein